MQTFIELPDNTLELYSISSLPSGYGHRQIKAELLFEGQSKTFSETINNMSGYDEAMDIEDYSERQKAIFELIEYAIQDEVLIWIQEINEKK